MPRRPRAHRARWPIWCPAHLQGRYWAVSANSWDVGYIVGPAVGGFVLAAEPLALWPLAAGVCGLAVVARSRWSG